MSLYSKKASQLQDLLADMCAMGKQASQKIKHIDVVTGQNNLGDQMEKEQHDAVQGINADNPAQVPAPSEQVRQVPGGIQQSITKDPASVLGGVNKMDESEHATSASLTDKVASYLQATIQGREQDKLRSKVASVLQAVAARRQYCPTGLGTMAKFASYMETADKNMLEQIHNDLTALSDNNPLFQQAAEAAAIRKIAEQAQAIADATGVSPQEAGAMLEQSIASDPEAAAEMQGEIDGQALNDLASAQSAALQDEANSQQLAEQATAQTGQEVSPQDIDAAIQQVTEAAAQMGVDPEDLIIAAAEQMQGEDGEQDDPQADALTDELLQEAADQGVSPEELIQGLAGDLGEDDEQCQCGEPGCDQTGCQQAGDEGTQQPTQQQIPADQQVMTQKQACLDHLAGTIRGQTIARMFQNM